MKRAVILFNLGGPDSLSAVQPFLFNLFNDPAIISLPQPLRWGIAKFISTRRNKQAQEIYKMLGGASPLLQETQHQARALSHSLTPDDRVFIVMRYWHPRAADVVKEVSAFNPDEVVLLPLYPQLSITTTVSSYKEWMSEAEKAGLKVQTRLICCYPDHEGVTKGYADLLRPFLNKNRDKSFRVLFSAHGLPESKVKKGDPYPEQVQWTVDGILSRFDQEFDWVLCYQSRVGPVKWIGPETEAEIERAGQEGKGVIVLPVAFVSEHSETLVELDIEYRHLAQEKGVPFYERVPALGVEPAFIKGLADLVLHSHPSQACQKQCPWRSL